MDFFRCWVDQPSENATWILIWNWLFLSITKVKISNIYCLPCAKTSLHHFFGKLAHLTLRVTGCGKQCTEGRREWTLGRGRCHHKPVPTLWIPAEEGPLGFPMMPPRCLKSLLPLCASVTGKGFLGMTFRVGASFSSVISGGASQLAHEGINPAVTKWASDLGSQHPWPQCNSLISYQSISSRVLSMDYLKVHFFSAP